MSTARIEKLFQKIQSTSNRLDEIYDERRNVIEQLANCHAKADELNETKKSIIVLCNSVNREIDNFYSRLKNFNEWAEKSNSSESRVIARKNALGIKLKISELKIKKDSYKENIDQIQSELDTIFQKITELNIQKKNCNDEIHCLRQKKDEYKRKIDSIKGKK